MVFLEVALFIIGAVAVISAINFIAKTTSNITHSFGIPEYLASTIVVSFVILIPLFLVMHISNFYDVPVLGISAVIGFSVTMLTLIMGIFLLKNKLPVEYEGYRNATFMWVAALLLLIVSFDKFIDRMDAIFLLALFTFYMAYVYYRSSKSKEYVYLKKHVINRWLYPIALISLGVSSWFLVYSFLNLKYIFNLNIVLFGAIGFSLLFVLPMFSVIGTLFRSSRLTFDNILGNVVIAVTLVPGIAALITPIPLSLGGTLSIMPFILLNMITLLFAIITRLSYTLHKKMGVLLLVLYGLFVVFLFIV